MGAFGNPIGRRGFNFTELVIRRAGGREGGSSALSVDITLGLWALLFCPSPADEMCLLWPRRYLWSQPAPADLLLLLPTPRCCDGLSEVSSGLAGLGQPACAALCTEELLCFSPDVGQPGTEIFNMPAITGAGNSRAVSVPYLTPCRAHRWDEQEAR